MSNKKIGEPIQVINPEGVSYASKSAGKGTAVKNVSEGMAHRAVRGSSVDRTGKTKGYKKPVQHKNAPGVEEGRKPRSVDKTSKAKNPSGSKRKQSGYKTSNPTRRKGVN